MLTVVSPILRWPTPFVVIHQPAAGVGGCCFGDVVGVVAAATCNL